MLSVDANSPAHHGDEHPAGSPAPAPGSARLNLTTWLGIAVCLSQSAILSGLNLGLFSLGRLELTVAARKGDHRAQRILRLREDANFALVTILWGNVGVNVILALLSGSVLGGVMAFLFSTVVITIFAEIIPQAWFSRHALRMAALLTPLLRIYQVLLWPVARPTAWLLDLWLGGEDIHWLRERDLRRLIHLHMEAADSEIDHVEGQGALNFLEIDDVSLNDEGEPVDPDSVLQIEFADGHPRFPEVRADPADPFLAAINRSGKSWVILTDAMGEPRLVLDAAGFTREAIFQAERFHPYRHCHRPVIARRPDRVLGELIRRLQVRPGGPQEDIVDDDVILLWTNAPRIITGADILGRLLRGISRPATAP